MLLPKTKKAQIEQILKKYRQARNSDAFLFAKLYDIPELENKMKAFSPALVIRYRQELQEPAFSPFQASPKVRAKRQAQQKKIKELARAKAESKRL